MTDKQNNSQHKMEGTTVAKPNGTPSANDNQNSVDKAEEESTKATVKNIVDSTDAEALAESPPCNEQTDLESLSNENRLLQQEAESIRQIAGENLQQMIRAQAELENVRKRSKRDIENAHKYALEQFMDTLLPVLDSIELGINATIKTENIDDLHEGMQLTLKMFFDCLNKAGVQAVNPQPGDEFNPEQHEAVTMQASDKIVSGAVIEVMQKGYELNNRLLRPAMVIVAQ